MKKKSSLNISLALIGAMAIANCSGPSQSKYANKDECLADWNEPSFCNNSSNFNTHRSGSSWYFGRFSPFRWGSSGTTSGSGTKRGGFGFNSFFHSSGG